MKLFWERICKLIDLKSLITMAMIGCLVYGFIVNKIETTEFIPLVTMILTFYFAKKDDKEK